MKRVRSLTMSLPCTFPMTHIRLVSAVFVVLEGRARGACCLSFILNRNQINRTLSARVNSRAGNVEIMSQKIGEYDFSDTNRDKERERRFRLQALERLPHDETRLQRLREQPQEAARLLRVALEDVATHSAMPLLAVRAVIAARGNLDGLDLSQAELLALVYALAVRSEQLPRAA